MAAPVRFRQLVLVESADPAQEVELVAEMRVDPPCPTPTCGWSGVKADLAPRHERIRAKCGTAVSDTGVQFLPYVPGETIL